MNTNNTQIHGDDAVEEVTLSSVNNPDEEIASGEDNFTNNQDSTDVNLNNNDDDEEAIVIENTNNDQDDETTTQNTSIRGGTAGGEFDDTTTQITEINVPPSFNNDNYYSNPQAHRLWTDEEREAYEGRRREALTSELNRVQRTNFIHFSIMCFIPIIMIALVLMNSFSEDGECDGYGVAVCKREARSFLNAFGNDCYCYGVTLEG